MTERIPIANVKPRLYHARVQLTPFVLTGTHVRLEPLSLDHVDGLVAAANNDAELYRWTPVPQTRAAATDYVKAAIAMREAGTAVPFATVRQADNTVIGSTRFWLLEYWTWPTGHARHGRGAPDAGEIGWTWLSRTAVRTRANTEAKWLMLDHAFNVWGSYRVCFHTDERNERSRAALARIGAKFEGILRAHKMAVDHIPRNSARFSILADEWPAAAARLREMLR